MRQGFAIALLSLFASGCASTFAMPMTAQEAVTYGSGPALVAYLGQPDANPGPCNLRGTPPHLSSLPPEGQDDLMDGLVEGKVASAIWRRCANALVKSLPTDEAASFFDAMAKAYRRLLVDADLDHAPHKVERLSVLHRLYLDRKAGLDGHPQVVAPLFDDLRTALAKKKLGSTATYFGRELVETVDLEHGQWQGKPVDAATMDALAVAGNELTLTRFAERLSSAPLRDEAKRRILRIHIRLSPFPEVRSAGQALEDSILKLGHNPVSLSEHPVVKAWADEKKVALRSVVVRQQVLQQTAKLLGTSTARPTVSALPECRWDVLVAQLQSISRPVSACAKSSDLDPSPCIEPSDVSLDNPLTYLDKAGAIRFKDNVRVADILPLASRDSFTIPVRLGGKPAFSIDWGLGFERPENLDFVGAVPAGLGPNIGVRASLPKANRYRFDVHSPSGTFAAIVEGADVAAYRISSRGGKGETGAAGSDGMSGADGAECSDGSNGEGGGPGGSGGQGGVGGDITVQLVCNGACDAMQSALGATIVSLGGEGGDGGPGGRGGTGGAGGSGRAERTHTDENGNTVVDDPGCSPGSPGSSGSDGSAGPEGPNGNPGRVTFQRVSPVATESSPTTR
jgi:hypothetical protein